MGSTPKKTAQKTARLFLQNTDIKKMREYLINSLADLTTKAKGVGPFFPQAVRFLFFWGLFYWA
jgi:hypothetical protein